MVTVPPIEICAQRWVRGLEEWCIRVVREGDSPAQVARALSRGYGDIRTLSYHKGRCCTLTVSEMVRNQLGWVPGQRVRQIVIPGVALVHVAATPEDYPAFSLPAVRRADQERARAEALRVYWKTHTICARCLKPTPRANNRQLYCRTCAVQVRRERQRVYWHRHGKLRRAGRLGRSQTASTPRAGRGTAPATYGIS